MTRIPLQLACLVMACGAVGAARAQALPAPAPAPATAEHPVSQVYHGVTVTDPYRWLEDADDPAVQQWSDAQDQRTRQYLDGLAIRQPIYERLRRQISATSAAYYSMYAAGGRIFALYNQPPKNQPMIALLPGNADPAGARIIVDPNALNPQGTTAIDWFVPSPDGRLVAASLSDNGSEIGSIHVFDVTSGRQVYEVIPRAQNPTGGGSLAWRADSRGFWYTRYPGEERPAADRQFYMNVYWHLLGDDPAHDTYVFGRELPKIAEIALENRQNHGTVLATVANGDGGEYEHFLIDPHNRVRQITRFEDAVVAAAIGPDAYIYLVSRQGAPRGKLLRMPLAHPLLARARLLVPESDAVLQPGGEFGGVPIVVTRSAVYVREIVGGPSRVEIFGFDGRRRGALPLPEVAEVAEVEPTAGDALLYSVETYVRPPYFSRYDERTGKAAETALAQTSPVHFDDTEVLRTYAVSKDGTHVPLNIVHRRGTALDGSNPVLLYGYGGYGVNETPHFLGPTLRLWLDAGGIYVDTNLRGGGEFGEEWHRQGALTHKQNVFDDFLAAARYLIDQHYTSPAHLAIMGGSNGGLLMGAVLTQHPELFRAVVSQVGIYDALRAETEPNGAYNTTEFGSTQDPQQFAALLAYSPYHHVVPGTAYPAIFMATGRNDGRVAPWHSRKMIARLQAASTSGQPILLSISSRAGHGIGSSLDVRINQRADTYSFLFDQLGMRLPETGGP